VGGSGAVLELARRPRARASQLARPADRRERAGGGRGACGEVRGGAGARAAARRRAGTRPV
jgi:hypothetical protein